MSGFVVKKGFDIQLAGRPSTELVDATSSKTVSLHPLEFIGVKQRLKVAEGDTVRRGTELLEDKRDERFKLRAPAGGTIKAIVRGHRRFVERIVIEIGSNEEAERFKAYSHEEILKATREELLDQLTATGYLFFIRQRPFSRIADVTAKPKSIFVNAMNTGPFQADASVVAGDDPEALQAGVDALTRMTEGAVHLCMGSAACDGLTSVTRVQTHCFSGLHPAGNTSVHISRIDPMAPTDVVWSVKAVDLVLIGRMLLDGTLPATRIVAAGGPGIRESGRKHYRVRIGSDIDSVLGEHLEQGEQRLLNGDVLSGTPIEADGYFRLGQSALTVLREGRERRFLGWTSPGFGLLSFTRTVASTWLGGWRHPWSLGTSRNGGERAMVLTGHYDKVMPLNILVDFLIRAVLAEDTDEAIRLGILETDPEDFALCDFVCPCKTEIQAVIRSGLEMIEEEGI